MQGSAAAKLDALKYLAHSGHYHPGYTFIPASVEVYGYLGKPLVRYLNTLSEVATARGPALTKGSFHGLQAVRCPQELRSPIRTDVWCSFVTLLLALGAVGQFLVPVLRSLLRSLVASAPQILCFALLSSVMKQEHKNSKRS